jgi:hypothetical protein
MKKLHAFLFSGLFLLAFLLTSSTTVNTAQGELPSTAIAVEQVVTSGDLAKVIEAETGRKLTLKEKIALKVFGKKIKTISKHAPQGVEAGGKSQVIALVLGLVVGGLGIHRFYLGYTWQGIVQLLTAGGCGIWAIIDIIRIITGDLQPKGGSYEKTL